MVSGTELGTDLGVVLGARFLPVRSSTVTVEGVELVMRDLRWWTQSAARLSVGPRRDFVTREDPSPHPTAIPLPTVKEVATGSLVVVVNLTPLVLAGAGVGLLARFLYLVERYWNVRLRLKLEDRQLRSLIDQVGVENSTSRASLTRALEEVQTVHGVADPRDTLDILQVEAAVVAPTDEGLSDDDLSA